MSTSLLFEPIRIRDLTLRNRVVLSPMLTYQASQGAINDWHLMHLGKFAAAGVGLVFMESTKIDPRGCTTAHDPGIWDDRFIPSLRRLTDFVHLQGVAIGIQLGHSGRKARNSRPWEGRRQLADQPLPDGKGSWELIGPSAIAHYPNGAIPRELKVSDIAEIIQMWGEAARRADEAGFDVIEIHGAHGYLLHQFLSPCANQRTDEYGGSLENRMRFPLEVVRRVRQTWPSHKPLFIRLSCTDEGGWTLDDTVLLARALKSEGVDVIDCSDGGMSGASIVENKQTLDYGYQVPYAAAVRHRAEIATMAIGLIVHADQAEHILQERSADLVAIGRELLHNPNWVLDAAIEQGHTTAYDMVPPSYGYWLRKRALAGFERKTSASDAYRPIAATRV